MVHMHIIKPGLLTLVQDAGRKGYQAWGVPVGGAMDRFSAELANRLVGNPPNAPVLEITLMGPKIEVEGACQIALTGAQLSAQLNGRPVSLNETIQVPSGSSLQFGRCVSGCRAYLAVGGSWQIPSWLGSTSAAHPDGKGITLQSVIHSGQTLLIDSSPKVSHRKARSEQLPTYETPSLIRVLPGPEYSSIIPIHIGYFFSQPYRISPDSNRMGYRLLGTPLPLEEVAPVLSSGVMPGTVQITREGVPILLMADAQTTGGYHRFLQVIQPDVDGLGQAKPGDSLRFALISQEEARRIRLEKREREGKIWEALEKQ